jgi:DNA helicase-2/ATP-dependent DNA helicase PcrA
MHEINFEKELNAEQLAAVRAGDGPVLIIAAAGTGKTRTLIYRVAWLVEQGVRGENILLLTFTNKAAQEMMERARERVGSDRLHGMWGGTFHHVANRILRQHASKLDYRNDFTILDSDDQKSLCKQIYNELGHKGDKEFPKPEVVLSLLSLAANKDVDPAKLIRDRFADFSVDVQAILRVGEAYAARKRELNAMDFDDLLVNAVKLLEQHEGARSYYQHRFRYVMVDEYQDTNPVQSRFVRLLSGGAGNLLVVGDDFQSIYGWRGADYRNILDFSQHYPGVQTYKLVTNYRSVPGILGVANRCIAGNPEQFQKELIAVRSGGPKPTLVKLQDGQHQARHIIQHMRGLSRNGLPWREMAVLYRSHYHALELQLQLNAERIPYVITSGIRFFEQAHVKDVLCLPRLAQNPRDELAFLRLVCLLPGVAAAGAGKIWSKLNRRWDPLLSEDRNDLLAALPKRGKEAWIKVHEALEAADPALLRRNAAELVQLHLDAFYEEYAVESFENFSNRMEDINGMMDFSAQFPSMEAFLNEVALQTNLDEVSAREGEPQDAVRLGTIHQSKGLEYQAVYVLWCADGMFPAGRSLEDADSGGESEERRLFYVAVTRARDQLVLCMPQMRRQRDGGMTFYSPSRFVTELGEGLLNVERGGYY